MGTCKKNNFKKAIRHLKEKQIEEKLQLLNEIPTNNIGGLYNIEPEYSVQDPDIPGEVTREANFEQDDSSTDTTGLFDDDGTILVIEPPGDTSYVLGPMASMWYAWGNFTQIGYIGESDRKMVNLGRITGQLKNWNGESNFTSYGQLTLEQAVWFRDTPKYLNGYDNYRAFYPGPPSNTPDEFGRYYCTITGTPKPTTITPPRRRVPPVIGGPEDIGYPWPTAADLNDKPMKTTDPYGDLAILLVAAGIVGASLVALKAALTVGGTSAATGILSRLRYLAKLRMGRGALNPFGQTAVRSGAAGRQPVNVYSGRPYTGPRGNRTGTQYGTTVPQTGATYTNPGPLKGTPGTGGFGSNVKVNPRGTLDQGTLPQRYIDKYGSRSVLGQKQVKLGPKAARRVFGESTDNAQLNDLMNAFVEELFSQYSDPYKKIDEIISILKKYLKNNNKDQVKESKEVLSENRKRIFRDIKKPYVLPEVKQEKYKFKKAHKVRAAANKTINADLMKQAEVPTSFKGPEERLWGKYEKEKNTRNSQHKKNVVLDHLGGGDHFLEYVYENGRQKNQISYEMFGGKAPKKVIRKEQLRADSLLFITDESGNKETVLQSEINNKLDYEFNKELFEKYFQEQQTLQADKDPLFKKVTKRLKTELDYPDKPSKAGYPNDPPPEMVNGFHPEYGNKGDYYNKLDPQSAEAMPKTGNSEIDAKVEKAKRLKKILGKRA